MMFWKFTKKEEKFVFSDHMFLCMKNFKIDKGNILLEFIEILFYLDDFINIMKTTFVFEFKLLTSFF